MLDRIRPAEMHRIIQRFFPDLGPVNDQAAAHLMSVLGYARLLAGLGPAGRSNFVKFKALAETMFEATERQQFLAGTVENWREGQVLAELPAAVFTRLGIAQEDFLAFKGFADLCRLVDKIALPMALREQVSRLSSVDQTEQRQFFERQIASLEAEVANPVLPQAEAFLSRAQIFRQLLAVFKVFSVKGKTILSFNYPHFIWMSREPLPGRFQINNFKYGKWVITVEGVEQLPELAARLSPYFSRGELGRAKFHLFSTGSNLGSLIVYAQDRDPLVKEVIQQAIGMEPYWVTDELCYEADALANVIQVVSSQALAPQPLTQDLVERLRRGEFNQSHGLSEIQGQIILAAFEYLETKMIKANDNIFYVMDTYFNNNAAAVEEAGSRGIEPLEAYFRFILPVILAAEQADLVKQIITTQREKVARHYLEGFNV